MLLNLINPIGLLELLRGTKVDLPNGTLVSFGLPYCIQLNV